MPPYNKFLHNTVIKYGRVLGLNIIVFARRRSLLETCYFPIRHVDLISAGTLDQHSNGPLYNSVVYLFNRLLCKLF